MHRIAFAQRLVIRIGILNRRGGEQAVAVQPRRRGSPPGSRMTPRALADFDQPFDLRASGCRSSPCSAGSRISTSPRWKIRIAGRCQGDPSAHICCASSMPAHQRVDGFDLRVLGADNARDRRACRPADVAAAQSRRRAAKSYSSRNASTSQSVEQRLGNRRVAAIAHPQAFHVAAAQMHADRQVGRPIRNRAIEDVDVERSPACPGSSPSLFARSRMFLSHRSASGTSSSCR